MRLISKSYQCNTHDTVDYINKNNLVKFVFTILISSTRSSITVVVYKTEDYRSYLYFCDLIGDTNPISSEEYFQ